MAMLQRILLSALLTGIVLGSCLTVMHAFTVYPLIHKAERYEVADRAEVHDHADGHGISAAVGSPYSNSTRLIFSFVSNTVVSVAFAIFLNIGFTLRPFEHWRNGVYWGLAGLGAFFVVPAFIYAPTLPGSIEADHFIRQIWWVATVEASAFGIALAVLPTSIWIKAQGGLLIAIAFFIGAPPAGTYLQTPESLVNQFYFVTLVTNSIYWLVLGVLAAYCYKRCVIDKGVMRAGQG